MCLPFLWADDIFKRSGSRCVEVFCSVCIVLSTATSALPSSSAWSSCVALDAIDLFSRLRISILRPEIVHAW